MQVRRLGGLAVVLAAVSPVFGQWESGSDGTDGAYSPAVSTVVDLSLAASLCDCDAGGILNDPCRWDCPSPVAGRGVYDAQQWAVVFKYTTVNVPAGATITFGQHPSGAPVIWLATGNVTVSGIVNLDGEDGLGPNPPVIPYFGRPGPGGFQSGQSANAGGGSGQSFGLGPGSSPTGIFQTNGWASYANVPDGGCGTMGTGSTYGNSGSQPLIGGSGGGASDNTTFGRSGGAGGGAILIGSTTQITVGASGAVRAEGGDGGDVNCSGGSGVWGGAPGSGGAIRLRAETVSLLAGSLIVGRGGAITAFCGCGGGPGAGRGANGRVRIEASSITNLGTINGSQSFPGAPSPVFATTPPQLYVTSVCGQSAPLDPMWGINSADIDLNAPSACTVNIEATGVPVGTIVVVRAIPARGNIISVNSTPLADAGGGLRTATASVAFPAGRAELQLRANW
jgi:hypothetical protein